MKYIGILSVLFAAACGVREFSRIKKKHLSECRDFLEFISHLRIQLGCFLRTPREIASSFSSKPLLDAGFLGALGEGADFITAFDRSVPHLSLSRQEEEILRTLFSSIGEGYLEEGVKIIDSSYSRLEPIYRRLSAECQKSIKLASALSVTGALGFLILVI